MLTGALRDPDSTLKDGVGRSWVPRIVETDDERGPPYGSALRIAYPTTAIPTIGAFRGLPAIDPRKGAL